MQNAETPSFKSVRCLTYRTKRRENCLLTKTISRLQRLLVNQYSAQWIAFECSDIDPVISDLLRCRPDTWDSSSSTSFATPAAACWHRVASTAKKYVWEVVAVSDAELSRTAGWLVGLAVLDRLEVMFCILLLCRLTSLSHLLSSIIQSSLNLELITSKLRLNFIVLVVHEKYHWSVSQFSREMYRRYC